MGGRSLATYPLRSQGFYALQAAVLPRANPYSPSLSVGGCQGRKGRLRILIGESVARYCTGRLREPPSPSIYTPIETNRHGEGVCPHAALGHVTGRSGKGKGRSPLVLLGSGPGLWGRGWPASTISISIGTSFFMVTISLR